MRLSRLRDSSGRSVLPASGRFRCPPFTFTSEGAEAFRSCVEVGADGLDPASYREISEILASGETFDQYDPGKSGPDVTFSVPDRILPDLRSAFTVGWEGLDESDAIYEAANEVADAIGVASPSPAP